MKLEEFKKLTPEERITLEQTEKSPEDKAVFEELKKQFELEMQQEVASFKNEDKKIDHIVESVNLQNLETVYNIKKEINLDESLGNLNIDASFLEGRLMKVEDDKIPGYVFKEITNEDKENTNRKYQEILEKLKSIEQKELKYLFEKSYQYIAERGKKFDVGIPEFSFDDHFNQIPLEHKSHVAVYNSLENMISSKKDEKTLPIILHEQLHFSNSFRNVDFKERETRKTKVGFRSTWIDRANEEQGKDLLSLFNEAVTEKMAQDIFKENKDRFLSEYAVELAELQKEKDKVLSEKRETELLKSFYETTEGLDFYVDVNSMGEAEAKKEAYKAAQLSVDQRPHKVQSSPLDLVQVKYDAYKLEISVLDVILEKLAADKMDKESLDKEQAFKSEWEDLQKAYLTGNTLYLKRIEHVIGSGTLRSLSSLSMKNKNIKEYREEINALIDSIEHKSSHNSLEKT